MKLKIRWGLALITAFSFTCYSGDAYAETVLFVGNSFTFGAYSPVRVYGSSSVTDLNGEQIGGVPAIFQAFTKAMGMTWDVSLETSPGKDLNFHLTNKQDAIGKPWDVVILQGASTLSLNSSGDPAAHLSAANGLARLVHQHNSAARVFLQSTWSRADLVYAKESPWYGKPIETMADDLSERTATAITQGGRFAGTIEVGKAWNLAFREQIADPNPYDGVDYGKISLWTWDQYHASSEGYYLSGLVIFGTVTKVDPRLLAGREAVAQDLGINPQVARRLQDVAAAQLQFPPLSEAVEAERAKVRWIIPGGQGSEVGVRP